MFQLSLLWLGIGLVVGVLGLAARLRLAAWGRWGWLILPGIGMLGGLLGGWLGTLLLSKLFGTPTALWAAVLVIFLPWLIQRLRERSKAAAPGA